ncbi:unnamed protein product [Cyprideis torosa]|uniref:Uncharacterized protein n=1 Tax=Cyprideis torosa TaxID=163714 RepID=A0A7R8ZYB9_9CRUS|nr:unnamed protein product [Cyprideis torosa]CAG0908324.1 unnamed protein product [Cyprideis torosa]
MYAATIPALTRAGISGIMWMEQEFPATSSKMTSQRKIKKSFV